MDASTPSPAAGALPGAGGGAGRKAIFLDVDGTIMKDGVHIPALAAKAIRAARANGHLVFLSTGRGMAELQGELMDIGFDGAVSNGGAELGEDFAVIGGTIPLAFAASGEVAPRGVHKGAAIGAILERLDIDPADAIGVGDNWNDAEMFEVCGTAIAMGNAVDGVKALADQVTTSIDDDGIWNAFERNRLI